VDRATAGAGTTDIPHGADRIPAPPRSSRFFANAGTTVEIRPKRFPAIDEAFERLKIKELDRGGEDWKREKRGSMSDREVRRRTKIKASPSTSHVRRNPKCVESEPRRSTG